MTARMPMTLVLDVGKTHAKLLLIDDTGEVVSRQTHVNQPVQTENYTALGTASLASWLASAIVTLPDRHQIRDLSITTHGAAFCLMDEQGLITPPMDYEWDGYGPMRETWQQQASLFEETGSPALPLGLNAGLQLAWFKHTQPAAWNQVRHILPYPQYWGWWFTGEWASEISSLGCHTHLWAPHESSFSSWAWREGFDRWIPPLRNAWAPLGHLRRSWAQAWQLPPDLTVRVGAHDSNACLARYLHTVPGATVVSTGTWVVVMATHGQPVALEARRDELLNVNVEGASVPTGRFMGGREYAFLAGDADPALGTVERLIQVLRLGWRASPAFSPAGGPYAGQRGQVWRHGQSQALEDVPKALRPALAALYAAEITVNIIQHLNPARPMPVILEGPLAYNESYVAAVAAMLKDQPVWRSNDSLEGTARGAWMLAQWSTRRTFQTGLSLIKPDEQVAQSLSIHHEPYAAHPHPRLAASALPRQGS